MQNFQSKDTEELNTCTAFFSRRGCHSAGNCECDMESVF